MKKFNQFLEEEEYLDEMQSHMFAETLKTHREEWIKTAPSRR